MEKIMKISEIQRDNPSKYGKYARYKVDVQSLKDGVLETREDFLDDKQTEKDVNMYESNLKSARSKIHLKYLDKRIIYNGIMALLGLAEFFLVLGIGNLLVSAGVSNLIASLIVYVTLPATLAPAFLYVNQRKFYYSNDEIKWLDEIKTELLKCDDIQAQIYKMKQDGKMFEYDYQRLNKDYEATRNRNQERNIKMRMKEIQESKIRDKRIEEGIRNNLSKNNNHKVNNVDFDYFTETINTHKTIHKSSSIKEITEDLRQIISEEKQIREQSKYPYNSVSRGEKRRR